MKKSLWVTLSVGIVVVSLMSSASVLAKEAPASARPAVGEKAPKISAKTWLNCEGGKNPCDGTEHKAILVELWGTWCGPCVRSMPKIQTLWERYQSRGLLVVAITREAADDVKSFLNEKSYTMPVGCDPDQACIKRYKPKSWPSSYVIDSKGLVCYVGGPYGADAAIEKALGIESSAATLLTQYLDATLGKDKDALRASMKSLVAKAPVSFNIKEWAEGVLGSSPEIEGEPKDVKGIQLLDTVLKSWSPSKKEKRDKALFELAGSSGKSIDLRGWIVKAYGKAFPLNAKELAPLLESKKYESILSQLLDRAPSSSVFRTAAKDEGFQSYCAKKTDDTRTLARKGLMAVTYVFPGVRFDEEKNKAFWGDLSVSGVMMTDDRKKLLGLLIAGERVAADAADSWTTRKLMIWALMREFASGDAPSLSGAKKEAAKERKRMLRALQGKYGKAK